MKNILHFFRLLAIRLTLLLALFAGIGHYTSAQTVYPDYQDGKIYFKLRDSQAADFAVNPDDFTVQISEFAFLQPLASEFGIQQLKRPFFLNNDPKLLRTLELEFDQAAAIDQLLARLNQVPVLEYAEKVPLDRIDFVPNDSLYTLYNGQQNWNWHLDLIQADKAWDITHGSAAIKVAIVDNAVWVDHPDLTGKIVAQRDTYYNTNNANPPTSGDPLEWSHGTHCAGLAAGSTNNGIGIASVGYDVSIIAVKSAANNNANSIYGYTGIQWAANNGADVISMSWGGSGYSQSNQNIINTIHNMGIVLVAAAGNDNVTTPHYPSAYTNVISVASVDYNDAKSDFSNYATSVDLSSPGGISSPGPSGLLSTTFNTSNFGNYDILQGTSMACPVVSGLAGLILSVNPALTPDQVEAIMKNNADDISAQNPNYTGMLGAGRINAFRAIANTPYQPTAMFTTPVTTVTPGGNGIQFTDLSSGVPSQWQWNFQGGTPSASTNQVPPLVTYANAGVYDVSLTVTNEFGTNTLTMPGYVTVTANPAPYIFVQVSDSMPCISQSVTLSDASLYNPDAWDWTIEPSSYELLNGSTLNMQNPEIKFMVPGLYSVSLTASNANGSSSQSYSNLIDVRGAVPSYSLDFEDGTSGYFTLWDTIKSQSSVDSRSANQSQYAIHFHGDPVPTGWKGSPTSGTPDQAWIENRQFQAEAHICGVDATGMENVALELDLRQTYSLGPRYSWFRVLANGVPVANDQGIIDFNPTTAGSDPWVRQTFDLTAFAGSVLDITLQACNRFSYHVQGEGDNVFVDNLSIINTTGTRAAEKPAESLEVYPNPTNGIVNVKMGGVFGATNIRVVSLLGSTVYDSGTFEANGQIEKHINLSQLPAGIYLLSVLSPVQQLNRRIVLR